MTDTPTPRPSAPLWERRMPWAAFLSRNSAPDLSPAEREVLARFGMLEPEA